MPKIPKSTGLLTAYSSNLDRDGNTYWALRYIDFEAGAAVYGKVEGGLSNIKEIIKTFEGDESILFEHVTMNKVDFILLTNTWTYAGCDSETLAAFIKTELKIKRGE
jgi:hypothetical protein